MAAITRNSLTASDVAGLIPKYADHDSDIRFMSLVDLCNILNTGPPALLLNDFNICARTVEALLKLLDDTNGDVQSQALKSLGPLAAKAPPEFLLPFVEKLSSIETTRSQDRTIPATATRALIVSFPRPVSGITPTKAVQDAYNAVSRVLIPRLLGYIVIQHGHHNLPEPPPGMLRIDTDKGVDTNAIDLLHETLQCFGPMLQEAEKQALQKRLLEILNDGRTGNVAKKKAVAAMSVLAVYFTDSSLSSFVSSTIEGFRNPQIAPSERRLLITLVGSIARAIPRRFGMYLKTIAPFVLSALSKREYEEAAECSDDDETQKLDVQEVKEAALTTLDDLLSSCKNEMFSFTDEAVEAALRYLTYDPGMTVQDEDEAMNSGQENDDDDDEFNNDDEDFEEEGGMSDGDDASWKIRRCAAKVLYAIISTRGSGDLTDNGTLYETIAPVLITRFQEPEENVRLEIIATLAILVRRTGEGIAFPSTTTEVEHDISASQASKSRKRRRGRSDAGMWDAHPLEGGKVSPTESPSPVSGPRADLVQLSLSIVIGASKLLKQSSLSTKQAATTLLKDLVLLQNGGLSRSLGQVIEPIIEVIKTSSSFSSGLNVPPGGAASATGNSLRIEALELLGAICDTQSTRVIAPYVNKIVPVLVLAMKDNYLKFSSEAIGVADSLLRVLTPPRCSVTDETFHKDIEQIFDAVAEKAATNDADLEVRQRAIIALGMGLTRTANASDVIPLSKRVNALEILLARLKNETTRIASVQAIDAVASSITQQDGLEPQWARDVVLELANQLRKADRKVRAVSLGALKGMISNPAVVSCMDDSTIRALVDMLLPLLDIHSFNLLGTTMEIFTMLTKRRPSKVVDQSVNNALCSIVVAPLSGHVLDSFLSFVGMIGSQSVGQPLMHSLLQDVGVAGDPSIVGAAVGTLLASGGSSTGVNITDIVKELQTAQDDQRKCLALSILGEASLRIGATSPLQPDTFLHYFKSKSDKVPRAAAVALGRAGAGNIPVYLPVIMSTMKHTGPTQVLLLHSLKEILQYAGGARSEIVGYTEEIWNSLLRISEAEDNKAIGAECIGRLISIEPKKYLSFLQNYLLDPVASVRGMVIQAVRFALSDADENLTEALKPKLIGMLTTMLGDPVLENRRLALTTLNAATNNKAVLILPHLSMFLPLVIQESIINPALVREVIMGPFRHKVDDGLEIRKIAYETLHALMNTAFSRMDSMALFDRVIAGLEDEHYIKMLCNLMLTNLIVLDPEETIRRLDTIAEHFQAILSVKLKDNAVKQEVEKGQEASKDVLRVTVRLQATLQAASSSVPSTQAQVWRGYWHWVEKGFKSQVQMAEQEIKNQR